MNLVPAGRPKSIRAVLMANEWGANVYLPGKFCNRHRYNFPVRAIRRQQFRRNSGFCPLAYPVLNRLRMNVSIYQAAAAMNAQTRWQELITQNIAAASVPGFRKNEVMFSGIDTGADPTAGVQSSHYIMPVAGSVTNFKSGELQPTGDSMDFALDGPGFFEVQFPDGTKGYTRNGQFQLNSQGQIVTKQGYLVMGEGGPLQLNPAAGSTNITVAPNGTITQGTQVRGRMHVVEFKDLHGLKTRGDGYFVSTQPDAESGLATSTAIRQATLEESNTSATAEMASLITSMRMFETNQKVLQMQDERMGQVISNLGSPSSS